jgi:hypothetical protein
LTIKKTVYDVGISCGNYKGIGEAWNMQEIKEGVLFAYNIEHYR